MLIEALYPLHIRRPSGDLRLAKGDSVELEAGEAQKLLEMAPGKVKVVEKVIVEPAVKPDGAPLSRIYWQTSDGRILGPATPEFFLQDGDAFWISATFKGQIWFILDSRLRSKKLFETQRPLLGAELIRERNEPKGPTSQDMKRSKQGGRK
ncbi:MAG: hypothetical protein LV473_17045 [Nitrospira sp.]|nr:hypothetical protein [Nitrospira sp.]